MNALPIDAQVEMLRAQLAAAEARAAAAELALEVIASTTRTAEAKARAEAADAERAAAEAAAEREAKAAKARRNRSAYEARTGRQPTETRLNQPIQPEFSRLNGPIQSAEPLSPPSSPAPSVPPPSLPAPHPSPSLPPPPTPPAPLPLSTSARGASGAGSVVSQRVPEPDVAPELALFAWCQGQRLLALPTALPEQAAPPGWTAWYRRALAEVGGDEARLRGAWVGWLDDAWGRQTKPPCASRAFIGGDGSTWRKHVPGQSRADRPAPRGGLEQASTAPDAGCACCSEPASGLVWGQPLCAAHGMDLMDAMGTEPSAAAAARWVQGERGGAR